MTTKRNSRTELEAICGRINRLLETNDYYIQGAYGLVGLMRVTDPKTLAAVEVITYRTKPELQQAMFAFIKGVETERERSAT